jgi:hypothetical protein
MRGGEKVLELLCKIFLEADLYTMVHVPGSVSRAIGRRRIVTSWLNRLPFAGAGYRTLLAFKPAVIRNHALEFDRRRCREALRDYLLGGVAAG